MKSLVPSLAVVLVAGCASTPPPAPAEPYTKTPNWEEIDKTVQRVKERKNPKPPLPVETVQTSEQGYFPMSEADYAAALDTARTEARKANPKMSDADVETEAVKRADAAKWKAEHTYTTRASTSFKIEAKFP